MTIRFMRGQRFFILNSIHVLLPGPISDAYCETEKVFIVLDAEWSVRNVFCFDHQAQLLWIIEEPEYFKKWPGEGYETVFRDRFQKLTAHFRSRTFYLESENGKVTFAPDFLF